MDRSRTKNCSAFDWIQFSHVAALVVVAVLQSPIRVWLCDPMDCITPDFQSFTISWSLLKLMSIELVMPSNPLILCRPLLLLFSIFPSIRVFFNESALHIRWPKDWSFSFSIVLPVNIQSWFPLGLTGLTSLLSKGLSRVFSSTTIQKNQFFGA